MLGVDIKLIVVFASTESVISTMSFYRNALRFGHNATLTLGTVL